jgi:hypothetical protein
MEITRLRQERKMKERLRVGTPEGQASQAKKRLKKTLKKKEKHREQVLQYALRK